MRSIILSIWHSPVVQEEMRTKHPTHQLSDEALDLLATADDTEIGKLDVLAFRQLLNKFDNGAAPGYDGWTAGIMKSLMKDAENLALHVALLHDISNGRMITPLAQLLQRGRLVALTKQQATGAADGTHIAAKYRPVMISTCLYRLAARIVSDSVKLVAAYHLSPIQLGIATPGAIGAAAHSTIESFE